MASDVSVPRGVSGFLADWYGPPDRPSIVAPAADHLPPPLRAWCTAPYRR